VLEGGGGEKKGRVISTGEKKLGREGKKKGGFLSPQQGGVSRSKGKKNGHRKKKRNPKEGEKGKTRDGRLWGRGDRRPSSHREGFERGGEILQITRKREIYQCGGVVRGEGAL